MSQRPTRDAGRHRAGTVHGSGGGINHGWSVERSHRRVYCHDNEHARHIDHVAGSLAGADAAAPATGKPFADLKALLVRDKG